MLTVKSQEKVFGIFLTLVLVALLVACSTSAGTSPSQSNAPAPAKSTGPSEKSPQVSDKPYKIGLIVTTTGRYASMGDPQKKAAFLAVDEINEAGGVKGRKLELIFADDEANPDKATSIARRMISEDKVVGLIAASATNATQPITLIAEDQKIPQIALVPPRSISKDKKFVFQTPVPPEIDAEAIVIFAVGRMKWKTVGILQEPTSYGTTAGDAVEQLLTNKGVKVVREKFQQGDTDLTSVLLKLKAANPDGIYLVGGEPTVPAIALKNRKQLGITTPVVAAAGLANAKMIELSGDAGEGVYFQTYFGYTKPSPIEKRFAEDLAKKYPGEIPTLMNGIAYDAVLLFAKAIETAGDDPAKIRDALEGIRDFEGATGKFTYSPSDHSGRSIDAIKIVKLTGGKFVFEHEFGK